MELILHNTVHKLSNKYLCKDVFHTIFDYVNIIDYYDVKYSIKNIQSLTVFQDMIAFISYDLKEILIYRDDVCIHTISLNDLSINVNCIHSMDMNRNYVILGTVYGNIFIINIQDNSLQKINFYDCVTYLQKINEEYFIVSILDNTLHLCDIYGNIYRDIDIESYITSFKQIDDNTFFTGSIDGKIQVWKFDDVNIDLTLENTHDYYFGNSIHSIISCNNKILTSYSSSNYIYEKSNDDNNNYEKIFCSNSFIISMNILKEKDSEFIVLLCEDGFLYIYDQNFVLLKKIFVDIYNVFSMIHVFGKKLLVENNGNVKIIF